MSENEIHTVKGIRCAIKHADNIYVQPNLGVTEEWVRISFSEALYLFKDVDGRRTSRDYEACMLGHMIDRDLYIGG